MSKCSESVESSFLGTAQAHLGREEPEISDAVDRSSDDIFFEFDELDSAEELNCSNEIANYPMPFTAFASTDPPLDPREFSAGGFDPSRDAFREVIRASRESRGGDTDDGCRRELEQSSLP